MIDVLQLPRKDTDPAVVRRRQSHAIERHQDREGHGSTALTPHIANNMEPKTMPLKTTPYDAAKYLDTEEAVAAFLTDAFESGDDAVFQEALQIAARAHGMSEVARTSGLGRESLYKALQADAQPRFATVRKVMSALGVQLAVVATRKSAAKRRVALKPRPPARSGDAPISKAAAKPHRPKPASR